jgi:hypothetical protein
MKLSGKTLPIGGLIVLVVALGAAILLHAPAVHRHLAGPHGAGGLHGGNEMHASGPAAVMIGESAGIRRSMPARDGVAPIGRRWDQAAFAETVALCTAVHRGIAWPGVPEPELVHYGPDPEQTFGHLHHRGAIKADLAAAVPKVAQWSNAALPSCLRPDEVAQVLRCCDRQMPEGRRDYAIVLLLAHLGLPPAKSPP